jgi:hypothetical protein
MFQRVMDGYADTPQERVLAEMMNHNPALFFQMWQEATAAEQQTCSEPVVIQEIESAETDQLWCAGHKAWHNASEFRKDYAPGKRGGHASCRAYYERNKPPNQSQIINMMIEAPRKRTKRVPLAEIKRLDQQAPPGYLSCSGCGYFKPDAEFDHDITRPHRRNRHTRCKACKRAK